MKLKKSCPTRQEQIDHARLVAPGELALAIRGALLPIFAEFRTYVEKDPRLTEFAKKHRNKAADAVIRVLVKQIQETNQDILERDK